MWECYQLTHLGFSNVPALGGSFPPGSHRGWHPSSHHPQHGGSEETGSPKKKRFFTRETIRGYKDFTIS